MFNNSSAVAEMGESARTKWAEKWGGAAVLFSMVGAVSPSNTTSPGPRATSIPPDPSSHLATWAEKGELLCPFPWGEMGLHLTQCAWAEAYLHTK